MLKSTRAPSKLTTRQATFLSGLVELYCQTLKPVHYSVLARKLGLCSSTAYDMLKVLEKKGMVISQYFTVKQSSGPGRASILFLPATQTIKSYTAGESYICDLEHWAETRNRIMDSLTRCKDSDSKDLVRGLMKQSNKKISRLECCAQILAALLISLKNAGCSPAIHGWFKAMLTAPASANSISSIAGLVLGLSLANQKVRTSLSGYQQQVQNCIASLQNMSHENLLLLQQFTFDAWDNLQSNII